MSTRRTINVTLATIAKASIGMWWKRKTGLFGLHVSFMVVCLYLPSLLSSGVKGGSRIGRELSLSGPYLEVALA